MFKKVSRWFKNKGWKILEGSKWLNKAQQGSTRLNKVLVGSIRLKNAQEGSRISKEKGFQTF